MFQLLQRTGKWSQVPENSQLFSDIKHRLIFIFQYHKDFYNLEEEYLSVSMAMMMIYCHNPSPSPNFLHGGLSNS